MTTPNLTQLNLLARDFNPSLAFYRRLGLMVAERAVPDLRHRHAEAILPDGFLLEIDNLDLAATYHAGWRRPQGGSRAILGFSLPTRGDVDRVYAELTGNGFRGGQRFRRWPPRQSPGD